MKGAYTGTHDGMSIHPEAYMGSWGYLLTSERDHGEVARVFGCLDACTPALGRADVCWPCTNAVVNVHGRILVHGPGQHLRQVRATPKLPL